MIPYKDDNPTRTTPYVTIFLIAANTLVYILLRSQGYAAYESAIINLGMIPSEIFNGVNLPTSPAINPYVTILSSMFMHAGFFHLAGNMLYLWIFGNNVEDHLGHAKFFIFYILCGIAADTAHLVLNVYSTVPTVGASGAIAGVLGAYLVLFPRARVHVLVFIFFFITTITVPAGIVLVFWFIFQVIAALPSLTVEGGVAYWAHIGGFVAGYAWVWLRLKRLGLPSPPFFYVRRR